LGRCGDDGNGYTKRGVDVMSTMVLEHKFEQQVGAAPYRFLFCESLPSSQVAEKNPMAYESRMRELAEIARSNGVTFGDCDVCGTELVHNYVCENADEKRFVVGCDCVGKIGDHKLVSAIGKAEKQRKQELARERREAKRRADSVERDARLDLERKANFEQHGLWITDYELGRHEAEQERLVLREAMMEQNGWLIDVLQNQPGNFCDSMCDRLLERPFGEHEFTDKMLSVMQDVYGKAHGRRGSKAYDSAIDVFDSKLDGAGDSKQRN